MVTARSCDLANSHVALCVSLPGVWPLFSLSFFWSQPQRNPLKGKIELFAKHATSLPAKEMEASHQSIGIFLFLFFKELENVSTPCIQICLCFLKLFGTNERSGKEGTHCLVLIGSGPAVGAEVPPVSPRGPQALFWLVHHSRRDGHWCRT